MPSLALPGDASDLLKMETRKVFCGGLKRTYTLYLPPSYNAETAAPLLLLFHGGGGIGKRMVKFTGFDEIAGQAGLIIVCPDGVERHWNDGRRGLKDRASRENVDDVGFVATILDTLTKEFKIDSSRVYASGISNGAMLSYRLGLELPDRIAAIAPVAGSLPEPLSLQKWTERPLPVIIINGTRDPLVPFEGGEVNFFGSPRGRVLSVPQTAAFWAKHNKCAAEPLLSEFMVPANKSGMSVQKTEYKNCCSGADVEMYAVEGGGHTWPRDNRLSQYLPVAVIGKNCRDLDCTQLIWKFFQRHSLTSRNAD